MENLTSSDVATWISDAIGVVAIIVAVRAGLAEQRRAREEVARAEAARVLRLNAFIKTAADVVNGALAAITPVIAWGQQIDQQSNCSQVAGALQLSGHLRALDDAVVALQYATPLHAEIAICLARVHRLLANFCEREVSLIHLTVGGLTQVLVGLTEALMREHQRLLIQREPFGSRFDD